MFDGIVSDFDLQSVVDETPDPRRDHLKEEVKEFVKDADMRFYGIMAEEFARALKPASNAEH